jgi:hypothetical protein
VKALTLQHPWVWCIFHAGKDVENRTWHPAEVDSLKPGDLLLIHGGRNPVTPRGLPSSQMRSDWSHITHTIQPYLKREYRTAFGESRTNGWTDLVLPGIVGAVQYQGWSSNSHSHWAAQGQYHWSISNPVLFQTPLQIKGALGLWDLPTEHEQWLQEQLALAGVAL